MEKSSSIQHESSIEESLWIDSQLTQFDNTLRLNYNKPLEEFAEIILTQVCQMTDCIRGAFFLVDQESPKVEALAGYACTPNTMPKRTYEVGEGLVGQVVKTRKALYFKDLYKSQVAIQSSAGAVNAGAIIVSPLVFNDQVYGVLELLFVHEVSKKFGELIERLSANVAAMLQSIIINAKTKHLLEISTKQAEELRASEEELRQNLEEVEAIQEEMNRRSRDFENRLEALNNSELGSIEFDIKGNILAANTTFLNAMGYTLDEIKGKHHRIFVGKKYAKSEEYQSFWERLGNGEYLRGEFLRYRKNGKPIYISGAYVPIVTGEKKEVRIWKLVTDVTRFYEILTQAGFEIDEFSRIKQPTS